jgi:hypothetical protein
METASLTCGTTCVTFDSACVKQDPRKMRPGPLRGAFSRWRLPLNEDGQISWIEVAVILLVFIVVMALFDVIDL